MPNALVQATAEGLPKNGGGRGTRVDLFQIMKSAWARYRSAKAYVTRTLYIHGSIVRLAACRRAAILSVDRNPFRDGVATERGILSTELAKLERKAA